MPSFESLADRPEWPATNHLSRIFSAFLRGVFACAICVGTASAQENSSRGLSTTEALNEQQLQVLASQPESVDGLTKNCAPQSLSSFVQPKQIQVCGVGVSSQAPQTSWILSAGGLIGQQLINWGRTAGWQVIWQAQKDWSVPSAVEFYGNFTTATSQVLNDLAAQGASIHAVFYQGNRTLVITGGDQ